MGQVLSSSSSRLQSIEVQSARRRSYYGGYHRTIQLDLDHEERLVQALFESIETTIDGIITFCSSFLFVPILEDSWSLIYLSIGLLLFEHAFGSVWLQNLSKDIISPEMIIAQAMPSSQVPMSPVVPTHFFKNFTTTYESFGNVDDRISPPTYFDETISNKSANLEELDEGMISSLLGLFWVLSLILSITVNLAPSISSWWSRHFQMDASTAVMGCTLVGMICMDAFLLSVVVYFGYRHLSCFFVASALIEQTHQHQELSRDSNGFVEQVLDGHISTTIAMSDEQTNAYQYVSNFLFLLMGFWFGSLLRTRLLRREIYENMGR